MLLHILVKNASSAVVIAVLTTCICTIGWIARSSDPITSVSATSCSGIFRGVLTRAHLDAQSCRVSYSRALTSEQAAAIIAHGRAAHESILCKSTTAAGSAIMLPQNVCADRHLNAQVCSNAESTDVLIVGSSVARGTQYTGDGVTTPVCDEIVASLSQTCGWAGRAAQRLRRELGLCTTSEAISGTTVDSTGWTLRAALGRHKPKVVVIGLAPANEGLPYKAKTAEQADEIASHFLRGMRKLADDAAAFPGVQRVVLGGVYPHGVYNAVQRDALYRCAREMAEWPFPVINFLNVTEDPGTGRWREGLSQEADFGTHPNAKGYQRMFEAIDLNLFKGLQGR